MLTHLSPFCDRRPPRALRRYSTFEPSLRPTKPVTSLQHNLFCLQSTPPTRTSHSHEEGLVAIALLGCAGKRPPSRSSAGRVDSGAWEELLSVGGENVRDLALGGRVHPDVANASESNGTSINDPKAQRQRQEQEQQQHLLEMEELAGSMPKLPPFGDIARSHSSNNSRSSSRKARFLSRNADSASIWPTMSTDSANLYSLIHYKNSSGSGSSGGGGPSREGGGRDATANAGGGRSSGSSGGGASWERAPSGYPAALSSSAGAGGATMTHDGEVITSNSCSSNNGKFGYAPHPLREQSFQPDRPIADLPSAKDICPDQPVSGPAATSGGGVQDWEKAAAVATSTTTSTTPSSTAASVATNGSGFFVARDHENAPAAAISACPPSSHGNHNNHVNAGGPIAPAPAPRLQPAASTRPPPAPVEHERKPSYNLLAMMIPDISKFGGPPTGAPLHAPGAVPGAAPGGAGFPAARGFAPAASAHLSPVDSYLRVGFEGDRTWTRQVSLHACWHCWLCTILAWFPNFRQATDRRSSTAVNVKVVGRRSFSAAVYSSGKRNVHFYLLLRDLSPREVVGQKLSRMSAEARPSCLPEAEFCSPVHFMPSQAQVPSRLEVNVERFGGFPPRVPLLVPCSVTATHQRFLPSHTAPPPPPSSRISNAPSFRAPSRVTGARRSGGI